MKNRLANQRIVISNQKVFLRVPSLFFLTKTLIFNASFSSSARALDKETNIVEIFIQADNLGIDMFGVLSAGIFYIIGSGNFKSSWTQQWISRYDIDDEHPSARPPLIINPHLQAPLYVDGEPPFSTKNDAWGVRIHSQLTIGLLYICTHNFTDSL